MTSTQFNQARAVEALLRQIQRSLRRPVHSEIARGRLTAPQLGVMRALAHAGTGLALKDLAAEIGLCHSTASGVVDRLEERGWVQRHDDRNRRTANTYHAGACRSQAPRFRQVTSTAAVARAASVGLHPRQLGKGMPSGDTTGSRTVPIPEHRLLRRIDGGVIDDGRRGGATRIFVAVRPSPSRERSR